MMKQSHEHKLKKKNANIRAFGLVIAWHTQLKLHSRFRYFDWAFLNDCDDSCTTEAKLDITFLTMICSALDAPLLREFIPCMSL